MLIAGVGGDFKGCLCVRCDSRDVDLRGGEKQTDKLQSMRLYCQQ